MKAITSTNLKKFLTLILAVCMVMSLMNFSVFADEEEPADPLHPASVTVEQDGITLTKTAERTGPDTWEVTVKAEIGELPIEQKPLEVVFVLDKSGSMNWCVDPNHTNNYGSHTHTDSCYDKTHLVCEKEEHTHSAECYRECTIELNPTHYKNGEHKKRVDGCSYDRNLDAYKQLICEKETHSHSNSCYKLTCTKYLSHTGSGNGKCTLPNGEKDDQTRLVTAVKAITTMVGELPEGTRVRYITFDSNAGPVSESLSNVNAQGGTNIMSGVDKAITDGFTKSNASRKILVLVSDGEDNNNNYTSTTLQNFTGDVFTVGFMLDNPNLKKMIKGAGKYYPASSAAALVSALEDINKFALSLITDPMGSSVKLITPAKDIVQSGELKGVIDTTSDGTIHWVPKDEGKIENTYVEYKYSVQLKNPSATATIESGIALNGKTTFQYATEKSGVKTGHAEDFNIPAGTYAVSTLKTQWVAAGRTIIPETNESVISDYPGSAFTAQECPDVIQVKGTNNYYKYVGTTVTKNGNPCTTNYGAIKPSDGDAYVVIHNYELVEMYTVKYEYTNHPEFSNITTAALPDNQLYAVGTDVAIAADPSVTGYVFSGWSQNETFKMPAKDVTISGSWTAIEYKAQYEFKDVNGGTLPADVMEYLPEDSNVYFNKNEVLAIAPKSVKVPVREGTWSFKGYGSNYDVKSLIIDNGDVTFTGYWEFAKGTTYIASYSFEPVDGLEKELPAAVIDLTPANSTGHYNGDIVEATMPTKKSVEVREGTWTFKGYGENFDITEGKIENSDIAFVGYWDFTKGTEYKATYEFKSATADKELPAAVIDLTPANSTGHFNGDTVTAQAPAKKSVEVRDGVWTFKGYGDTLSDVRTTQAKTIDGADVKFTGYWEFTKGTTYIATYSFKPVAGLEKELPAAVIDLTPANSTGHYNGDTVTAEVPAKKSVEVREGTWTFKGYGENFDITEGKIENSDIAFVGYWDFTKGTEYKATYEFKSATAGKDLPDAVKNLLPEDSNVYFNRDEVLAIAPKSVKVPVREGTWSFKGYGRNYDVKSLTVDNDDVKFTGYWEFTKGTTYIATYSFEPVAGLEKELPAAVIDLTPANSTGHYNGDTVTAEVPAKKSVEVREGTWTFKGYGENFDITEGKIENSDIAFVGYWDFTAKDPELFAVIYHDGYRTGESEQTYTQTAADEDYDNSAVFTMLGNEVTGFTRPEYSFAGWSMTLGTGADDALAAGKQICLQLNDNGAVEILIQNDKGSFEEATLEEGKLLVLQAIENNPHTVDVYANWVYIAGVPYIPGFPEEEPKPEVIYHEETDRKDDEGGENYDPEKGITADDPIDSPEGKSFEGWTDEPGGEVVYKPGDKIVVNDGDTVDLWPVWKDVETEVIENTETPLTEFVEGETPLAALPEGYENLLEDGVPLADVPTTGDNSMWEFGVIVSGILMGVMSIFKKKKRTDEE